MGTRDLRRRLKALEDAAPDVDGRYRYLLADGSTVPAMNPDPLTLYIGGRMALDDGREIVGFTDPRSPELDATSRFVYELFKEIFEADRHDR